MSRANIEYLQEHGPTGFSELPGELTVEDRMQGAARLRVEGAGFTRHTEPVAYLFDEHEPEEVIEVWFELNREYVEEIGYDKARGQFTALGRPWSQLASEHLEAPEKPWVPRKDEPTPSEEETSSPSLLDRLLSWGGSP